MAYSVDWTARIITIPLDDLTFVSGSVWSLDASDVWIEVRRLEASPSDGLGRPQALEFVNTQILSDIPYSPIVKLINGYTWKTGTTDKVITLLGPNNNLLDTFIPGDGVSVLANNSAGKTEDSSSGVSTGSGLTDAEKATLAAIYADTDELQSNQANWATADITGLSTSTAISTAKAVWDVFLNDHLSAGSTGEKLANAGSINIQNIVDGVWDAPANAHIDAGTLGLLLNTPTTPTVDNAAIASAVWESSLASHVTAGTFGLEFQTALSTDSIAAAVTADMDLNSNLLTVIRTAVETNIPAAIDALHNFDPANDTVLLVDTVTNNTDMRGTDSLTDVSTEIAALYALEFNARTYDKVLNKMIVHDGVSLSDTPLYEWNTIQTAPLSTLEPV